ncbi:type II secretion system protein [Shewanella sp. Scap07]|uniref:type II secretion system protein n=1 Tax=Shewanella sp. Scap07 TaxID=2589987 RepID=UPI0015BE27BC|nr:prepilin-type N-terminal cleavage/methylation domain-containing protein [Shewanella sp. Scap07]QLE84464.1 type II secretion system protein [Shewanella sp. Scap07]
MNKPRGFTLIELVVVIVILGILAVVAAPKFINLSSDAKVSVIDGVAAAMKFAADETYLKAKINNAADQERSSDSNPPYVEIPAGIFELKYGYPEAWAEDGLDILDMLDISEGIDVCYGDPCSDSSNSSRLQVGYNLSPGTDIPDDADACYVRYNEPGGSQNPSDTEYSIDIRTDGC